MQLFGVFFSPHLNIISEHEPSVPSAFVVIYTVCHPCSLSVKYILGQWLHLTAEIRLLEVESLLYQYASLSQALHRLCSHTGVGISGRSVWTKKWVETGLSVVYNPPLAVILCEPKYYSRYRVLQEGVLKSGNDFAFLHFWFPDLVRCLK